MPKKKRVKKVRRQISKEPLERGANKIPVPDKVTPDNVDILLKVRLAALVGSLNEILLPWPTISRQVARMIEAEIETERSKR